MENKKSKKKKTKCEIDLFWHCSTCIGEIVKGEAGDISPSDYQKIQAGWTEKGFQVWCIRHGRNIININLNGGEVSLIQE